MKGLTVFLITIYQQTLSPDHGWGRFFFPHGYCRFQPTCSQYAKESVQEHGIVSGLFLATARVCRCHPLGATGHDPVLSSEVN